MATSQHAEMMFEADQTFVDYEALTDSGDHKVFTPTDALIFSGRAEYTPVVLPNGVVIGARLLSTNSAADTITVGKFTALSKAVSYTVNATTAEVTRPATNVAKVNSIIMTDAGVVDVVEGTDGSTTTFTETRGAAGGPPEIPVDAVEIGQFRTISSSSAAVLATELFQTPGTHLERSDSPTYEVSNLGYGDAAESPATQNAHVDFSYTMPEIHTSGSTKKVYCSYYKPVFAKLQRAYDFVPAEDKHSISSTQYYDGTIASSSSSLGQASFTALMNDNITDALVRLQNELLTFKFKQDKNRAPYVLTQGLLGMGRSFPVSNQNQAGITISAETKSVNFSS